MDRFSGSTRVEAIKLVQYIQDCATVTKHVRFNSVIPIPKQHEGRKINILYF